MEFFMSKQNNIVLVVNSFGGREALYLNGKLVIQNNPMPRFEITQTMTDNQPFSFKELEVCGEWLDSKRVYPDEFKDIPDGVFTDP